VVSGQAERWELIAATDPSMSAPCSWYFVSTFTLHVSALQTNAAAYSKTMFFFKGQNLQMSVELHVVVVSE
jgi:hypothetical protein